MRSVLKGTTQRYKSLMGFAIYAKRAIYLRCDMPCRA